MGTDNLFSKRKAKDKNALARKKANRSAYLKVLIVCEGQKTEPNYFNELKDHYQLNTANVEIDGNCGSDPMSVFKHARKCANKAQQEKDSYDKVYCVFDKDTHSNYQQALNKINNAKGYAAIVSVPCFEYWLLLHFVYTTQPFAAAGSKSASDKVIEELKRNDRLPNYQKASNGNFSTLLPTLESAKERAKQALIDAKANQTDNPSTYVHDLVDILQNLKKR